MGTACAAGDINKLRALSAIATQLLTSRFSLSLSLSPWSPMHAGCPSRASLHTGRLQHNTQVYNNSIEGGCNSAGYVAGPEQNNIARLVKQATGGRMRTSFAGKYGNNYGGTGEPLSYIPPGWDNWQALRGNSIYYNYELSNNGTTETHGNDYATDYLTDLVANRSLAFLQNAVAAGEPFFAMLSTPACHQPADPAPQYQGLYPGIQAPRQPNFNVHVPNTHWFESSQAVYGLDDNSIKFIDVLYRRRLQTLASVDDAVTRVVSYLQSVGQLDNTYFIYTGDNGYHLGQAGQNIDKRGPWDYDARVPFIIRGPGIAAGSTIATAPVSQVDIIPTMLDILGAPIPSFLDGQSLLPLLTAAGTGAGAGAGNDTAAASGWSRQTVLYEYHGENYGPGPATLCPVRDGGLYCMAETEFDTPPYFNGSDWCSCQDSKNNTFACMRVVTTTSNFRYCEFPLDQRPVAGSVSGSETETAAFAEYFDMTTDPWEMNNTAALLPPATRAALSQRLQALITCKGAACNAY